MNLMDIVKKVILYTLAIVLLFFTGYPFLYMIGTSFKSLNSFFESPLSIIPSQPTFEQYVSVFEMGLTRYFVNSILITVVSVIGIVFISALASYPLSRMSFKLNRPLLLFFVAGMMLPIHATLIPIFILTQDMGIYDTLWALLGPYIAFSLPVSIFILTQFMQEVPKELEEAAYIDGCGHFSIFWRIMLPLVVPAISTIVIYNFVFLWTEFIFALVLLSSPENMTLPLGLQNFYSEFSINIPGLMAALTLASLPILLLFVIAQNKVVKGLTGGAVKG
ncbi:raffinose/stachyose/melibiose transport system permease protein [Caldalkalibacillus uzonensis]|uniref:Raffinose/stachyose/melibiose transport system permease protein n=1 Tax=Caldalkalibacillus uzonensis TaxID=353224 RepID=A0ABU0CQY1_9BACI|nr:carbohydrate ABC transporter permease [Caldalkalibacillus uzonensis]MDQ0338816.1 raffinose/stachyose/melibiose transport system permease protein [Caldalkalibacillus uzonensis]